LFMNDNISHNLTIPSLVKFNRWQFIRLNAEQDKVLDTIVNLDIKVDDLNQEIRFLSGGNQQKIMLGKWLVAESDLYLLDEPTRGIDVGAKSELYLIMHELVIEGKGMIVFSSDISELIGLSSRIIIMHHGRIINEIDNDKATKELIEQLASGIME
jgi:ABC-type sugar transport system ATPase subunit